MIAVIIFGILVLWFIVKYILQMYHTESYVKHLKMVNTFIPFIGNCYKFVGKTSTEIFQEVVKSTQQHDTPYKLYIGSKLFIFIDKPEDIKIVLTQCLDKTFIYDFLPSDSGLATERSSAIWRSARKLLNPMFNLKTLQSFLPIFNEKANEMIEELGKVVEKSSFDILPYAQTYTLRGVLSTVLGVDIDLKSNRGKDFVHSINVIFDAVLQRTARPWTYINFIYRWTNLYKLEKKYTENVKNVVDQVFEEKTKEFLAEYNNNIGHENLCKDKKKPLPLIPLVLEGKLSEKLVKDQIVTLIVAGYETSSITVASTIIMLAMHPNIQEQVFQELRSIFKTPDEQVTFEHIQKMHLLDRVIKESMRLCPAGSFIQRESLADTPISNCTLPKNTNITILFFTLHRRKDIWGEDANEFNPDNFLPERVQSRHPFAFLPFSGGPRNCIGYQYAMFSMKVILSTLIRYYKFSTDSKWSDLEFKYEFTLKLSEKHMVKIEKRNW